MLPEQKLQQAEAINEIARLAFINSAAKGFHDRDHNDVDAWALARIALIGTELAEFVEEFRKPEPNVALMAEELADAIIRIGDLAHSLELDLGTAVVEKMAKNEARPAMHGKRM